MDNSDDHPPTNQEWTDLNERPDDADTHKTVHCEYGKTCEIYYHNAGSIFRAHKKFKWRKIQWQ